MKTAAIILLLSTVVMCGCSCGGGGNSSAQQRQSGLPLTDVKVSNSGGDSFTISAEVATTQAQQETGLMNRSSMCAGCGMLFVFPAEKTLSFWMKNTLIPLDMLFIGANRKIVDINKNAVPLSETPFTSAAPAKYVLEVNGGWCDNNNVGIGDSVTFTGY